MSSFHGLFRRTTATLLLLGAATGTQVAAADDAATDYWVRVMPAAWLAGFSGETGFDNGAPSGDHSLDSLDLANQEPGFGLEVSVKLPILFSFHAGGFIVGSDGSFDTLGTSYGGQLFTGAVKSSIDLRDLFAEADLQILDLDIAGFAIGVGYHEMNAQVELSGGGNTAKLDENLGFPVISLRGHTKIPIIDAFGAEAKIQWMDLSIDGNSIGFLDASVQVSWRPWNMLGFIAGYRYVAADMGFDEPAGNGSKASVDVTLAGPFLGLTAQF